MYWNVCRGRAGWEAVMRRIEYERPDLVALGEASYPTSEFRTLWRTRLPDYDISFVGGGMNNMAGALNAIVWEAISTMPQRPFLSS